ncbi:IS1634 family transposase [Solitalea lacus]|uniref:IS1634 family transposase n=1 Tax=Solitalea lacus TaxID=2911172 RepID=UPI001EDA1483|nr:IS1634 family transposase [Solitalea lacus]UKJ06371.1 IS1634 family transposase [Solitalea lacus]
MLRIRTVTTASGAKAVQVIYYYKRKRVVYKHIGSGRSEAEVESLMLVAQDFIDNYTPSLPFKEETKFDNLIFLDRAQFLGVHYTFLYEVLSKVVNKVGLSYIKKPLLLDLVIMRILEPASKLRSIELMDTYFGIRHRRQSFYKSARDWLELKQDVEQIVVAFAKSSYAFNFELLFYDVTTLYFETFEEDELRENGFSKDNKSQQPQILVALMVTKEGFPVSYEVFSGSTFEGHTILPVVQKFIRKHGVANFTIVADAAMISSVNVQALVESNINYIVGARLGNLSSPLIEQIDRSLKREDGHSIRIKTDNGYLICSYSAVRYKKDKYEMEKQIQKAETIIQTPSKGKKTKFTKSRGEVLELNRTLIQKTKKLLGIKGYYTNLEESVADNNTIIGHYHELYRIEQAFRISKSDLQTRPIFHYKEEPINLHLLVCFMSLVVSKHIELSTEVSIKKFVTELKKVTDARMVNGITGKEIRIRAKITPLIEKLVQNLKLPH